MAIPSVEELYRYLAEDPERVPFTGDKRKEALLQLATQEARQQRNNRRALDLLIDKAAPNQRTTPERSAKEGAKPVEAKRKNRFDLDIIQEFDINDLQWGQPSRNQGKQMQRPIKTMDLDVADLALPPFTANDSPETYQELLEIQEMGLLRDDRQDDINSQQTKEGLLREFKKYADDHHFITNWDFVRMVMDDINTLVLSLKFAFNRPRPDTLAQHQGILLSVEGDGTYHTPSYPSFHSTASRVVAEVIAGTYVGHKTELLRIADKIGMNRVIAGYHYLSDHQAGLLLANQLILKITTNLSINPVYEREETIDSKTAETVTENFMDTLEEMHRRGEAVKKEEDEGDYEDSYMAAIKMAIGRHADETAFMTDVNKAEQDKRFSELSDAEIAERFGGEDKRKDMRGAIDDGKRHIYVFGSNLDGQNYGGAAKHAWDFGASKDGIKGDAEDRIEGNTYSLPTKISMYPKNVKGDQYMTIEDMQRHFNAFAKFVAASENTVFHIANLGMDKGGFTTPEKKKQVGEAFNNAFEAVGLRKKGSDEWVVSGLKDIILFDKRPVGRGKGLADVAFGGGLPHDITAFRMPDHAISDLGGNPKAKEQRRLDNQTRSNYYDGPILIGDAKSPNPRLNPIEHFAVRDENRKLQHTFLSNYHDGLVTGYELTGSESGPEATGKLQWLPDGKKYPTVEHSYKASIFKNDKDRELIRNEPDPYKASQIARRLLAEGTDKHPLYYKRSAGSKRLHPIEETALMMHILQEKFEANPALREQLLATGDSDLVEGQDYRESDKGYFPDTHWGRDLKNPKDNDNQLGKLLVRLRGYLRDNPMSNEDRNKKYNGYPFLRTSWEGAKTTTSGKGADFKEFSFAEDEDSTPSDSPRSVATRPVRIPSSSPTDSLIPENSDGNVYSDSNDPFLAAITHPTTKSRTKGRITSDYPVVYKEKKYVDAEAAYTDLIRRATPEPPIEEKEKIMREVNLAKFAMYPALADELEKRGGIEYLGTLKHEVKTATGNKEWEGEGADSLMLSSLAHAFAIHKGLEESDLGAFQRENPSVWQNLADEKENVQAGVNQTDATPVGSGYVPRSTSGTYRREAPWSAILTHNFNYNVEQRWNNDTQQTEMIGDTPDAPNTSLHKELGDLSDAILVGIRTASSRQGGKPLPLRQGEAGITPENVKKDDTFGVPTKWLEKGWLTVRATRASRPVYEVPENEHAKKEGWSNHPKNENKHSTLSGREYIKIDFELVDNAASREAQDNFMENWREEHPDSPIETIEDFKSFHEQVLSEERPEQVREPQPRDMTFHSGLADGSDHIFGQNDVNTRIKTHGTGVLDDPIQTVIGHSFAIHTKGRYIHKQGDNEGLPASWEEVHEINEKWAKWEARNSFAKPGEGRARATEEKAELYSYDREFGLSPHGTRKTHPEAKLFDKQHKNALLRAREWIRGRGEGFEKAGDHWGEWEPDEDDDSLGKWVYKDEDGEIVDNTKTMLLMGRNVEQIRDSQAVVAVVPSIHRSGVPVGLTNKTSGTAWAVAMGIEKGIPVYVYDENNGAWNEWNNEGEQWDEIISPPYYQETATIGSRDVNERSVGGHAIDAWTEGARVFQSTSTEPFAPVKIWDKKKGAWDYTRSGPTKSLLRRNASEEDKTQLQQEGEELDKAWTQEKMVENKLIDTNAFDNPLQREQLEEGTILDNPNEWRDDPKTGGAPNLTPIQEQPSSIDLSDFTGGVGTYYDDERKRIFWDEAPELIRDDDGNIVEGEKERREWVIERFGLKELIEGLEDTRDNPLRSYKEKGKIPWDFARNQKINQEVSGIREQKDRNAYVENMVREITTEQLREMEEDIITVLVNHDPNTSGRFPNPTNNPIFETIQGNFNRFIEADRDSDQQSEEERKKKREADEKYEKENLMDAAKDYIWNSWTTHIEDGLGELINELGLYHEGENKVDEVTGEKTRQYPFTPQELLWKFMDNALPSGFDVSPPLKFERVTINEDGQQEVVRNTGHGGFGFMGAEGFEEADTLKTGFRGETGAEFDPVALTEGVWDMLNDLISDTEIVKGSDLVGIWSEYGSDDNKNTKFNLFDVVADFLGFDASGEWQEDIGYASSPTDDGPKYSLFSQLLAERDEPDMVQGTMNTSSDILEWFSKYSPEAEIDPAGTGESDGQAETSLGMKFARDMLAEQAANTKQQQQDLDDESGIEWQNERLRYITGKALQDRMLQGLSEEAFKWFKSQSEDEQTKIRNQIFPHSNEEVGGSFFGAQRGLTFNYPDPLGEKYYNRESGGAFPNELNRRWAEATVKFRREKVESWERTRSSAWKQLTPFFKSHLSRLIGTGISYDINGNEYQQGYSPRPGKTKDYEKISDFTHDVDYAYLQAFLKLSNRGVVNLIQDGHFGEKAAKEHDGTNTKYHGSFSRFLERPNALNILIDDVAQAVASYKKTGKGVSKYLDFQIADTGEREEGEERKVGEKNFKMLVRSDGRGGVKLLEEGDENYGAPIRQPIVKDKIVTGNRDDGFSTQIFLIRRLMGLGKHRDGLYTGGPEQIAGQNQWEDLTGMHHVWKETDEGEKPKYIDITLSNGTTRRIEARTMATYNARGKSHRNTEFLKQMLLRHMGSNELMTGVPDVMKQIYASFPKTPSRFSPFNNKSDINVKEEIKRLSEGAELHRTPMAGIMGTNSTREKINALTGEPEDKPVYNESFDPSETGEILLDKFKKLAESFGLQGFKGLGEIEATKGSVRKPSRSVPLRSPGRDNTRVVKTPLAATIGSRVAFPMGVASKEKASMLKLLTRVKEAEEKIREGADKEFEGMGEEDSASTTALTNLAVGLRESLKNYYAKVVKDAGGKLTEPQSERIARSRGEYPGDAGIDREVYAAMLDFKNLPPAGEDDYQALISHIQKHPTSTSAAAAALKEQGHPAAYMQKILNFAPYAGAGKKEQAINDQLIALAEAYTPEVRGMMHKVQHEVLTDSSTDPDYIARLNWVGIPKEYRLLTADDIPTLGKQVQEYQDSWDSLEVHHQKTLLDHLSNGAIMQPEEFFNPDNPNSFINWAETAHRERAVKLLDISNQAALNVAHARITDPDLQEEAYEHFLTQAALGDDDMALVENLHRTDLEEYEERTNEMVYGVIISNALWEERNLIQEFESTRAPQTGEEEIVGYEKDTKDDRGNTVKGKPIYETVEAPTKVFEAEDATDTWSRVVERDSDNNIVGNKLHAAYAFASEFGTNWYPAFQSNIRSSRKAFMDAMVRRVSSSNEDHSANKDVKEFLNTYLDIIGAGRLPIFDKDTKQGIYGLSSRPNVPPRRTKSVKGVDKITEQKGSALQFAQSLMRQLYSEKGMEIPDDIWDKFNIINSGRVGERPILAELNDKRRTRIRNIIDAHPIHSHENFGAVQRNVEKDLLDYSSEEGAERNGNRVHWTDSNHDTLEDWANEHLDGEEKKLQAGVIKTPTETYKPESSPLNPEMGDLEPADDGRLTDDEISERTSEQPDPDEPIGGAAYKRRERPSPRPTQAQLDADVRNLEYKRTGRAVADPSWKTRNGGDIDG